MMRRFSLKISRFFVVVVCVIIFSATACSPEVNCNPDEIGLGTANQLNSSEQEPSIREINFFIDATESMAGFATAAKQSSSASSYQDMMRSLENSIQNLPAASKINKYKFGKYITNLNDNPRLNDIAINETFYFSQDTGQETQIQNIFKDEDPSFQKKYVSQDKSTLSVIITELFQQGTDFGVIPEALAPYVMHGASIGLLGVDSEFSGDIFDYSGNARDSFHYTGMRPVYALVVGDAKNILSYFDLLKATSLYLKQNAKFTIFSNHILKKQVDFFQNTPFNVTENLVSIGSKNINDYFLFELKRDSPEPASFTICSEEPKPFSEDVAGYQKIIEFEKNVTVNEIVKTKSKIKLTAVNNSRINIDILDKDKCESDNSKPQNPLVLKTTIDKNDWQGTYLIVTAFKPRLSNYPNQWNEWSTVDVRKEPSKTLNLTELIKLFYSIIVQEYKPEIKMTFCIK